MPENGNHIQEPHRLPVHRAGSTPAPMRTDIAHARRELSHFILDMAEHTIREVGFRWVGVPDPPTRFSALLIAFADSVATGQPLPVSNQRLETCIYRNTNIALAARYWREVYRVRLDHSFSPSDELELGLWQVAIAESEGLSNLAVALLEADVVCQTLVFASLHSYPHDQELFVWDVLTLGIADAIVMEAERQHE